MAGQKGPVVRGQAPHLLTAEWTQESWFPDAGRACDSEPPFPLLPADSGLIPNRSSGPNTLMPPRGQEQATGNNDPGSLRGRRRVDAGEAGLNTGHGRDRHAVRPRSLRRRPDRRADLPEYPETWRPTRLRISREATAIAWPHRLLPSVPQRGGARRGESSGERAPKNPIRVTSRAIALSAGLP